VFDYFSDKSGSVTRSLGVSIAQEHQRTWEHFSLDDKLCQLNRMLRNLRQSRASLTTDLDILTSNKRGDVRHRSGVDNRLCQLWRMLRDISKSSNRNLLQS